MNDRERIELARQAQMALDDFLAPAFAEVEDYYREQMVRVSGTTDPRVSEILERLAIGVKVTREARSRIVALVADGGIAKAELIRAERIDGMTAPDRRLLNIGAN